MLCVVDCCHGFEVCPVFLTRLITRMRFCQAFYLCARASQPDARLVAPGTQVPNLSKVSAWRQVSLHYLVPWAVPPYKCSAACKRWRVRTRCRHGRPPLRHHPGVTAPCAPGPPSSILFCSGTCLAATSNFHAQLLKRITSFKCTPWTSPSTSDPLVRVTRPSLSSPPGSSACFPSSTTCFLSQNYI
jgi:hypothetical protein